MVCSSGMPGFSESPWLTEEVLSQVQLFVHIFSQGNYCPAPRQALLFLPKLFYPQIHPPIAPTAFGDCNT